MTNCLHLTTLGLLLILEGDYLLVPPNHPWKAGAVRAGWTDVAVAVRATTLETNLYQNQHNIGILGKIGQFVQTNKYLQIGW